MKLKTLSSVVSGYKLASKKRTISNGLVVVAIIGSEGGF